jgi:hypothetical protein
LLTKSVILTAKFGLTEGRIARRPGRQRYRSFGLVVPTSVVWIPASGCSQDSALQPRILDKTTEKMENI